MSNADQDLRKITKSLVISKRALSNHDSLESQELLEEIENIWREVDSLQSRFITRRGLPAISPITVDRNKHDIAGAAREALRRADQEDKNEQ